MQVEFVTLFPEMVLGGLRHSVIDRAEKAGVATLGAVNPREFATDAHKTVDARVFGGGPGMLMRADILDQALDSMQIQPGSRVVFPDPCGYLFTDRHARDWAKSGRVIFVCGHYEGIDDRLVEKYSTDRVSLGDFVLTGGELAAMVMADAVIRQIPGVLGDPESLDADSHSNGLLSYPQYTRPREFHGREVPEELLGGDHQAADKWRRQKALRLTRELRPDLFAQAQLTKADLDLL